jgi:hypothetical protein
MKRPDTELFRDLLNRGRAADISADDIDDLLDWIDRLEEDRVKAATGVEPI